MSDDLFPIPVVLSPRRQWLERHGLVLRKVGDQWACILDDANFHKGETEDDACIEFCLKTGIKHWNTL